MCHRHHSQKKVLVLVAIVTTGAGVVVNLIDAEGCSRH